MVTFLLELIPTPAPSLAPPARSVYFWYLKECTLQKQAKAELGWEHQGLYKAQGRCVNDGG